MPFFCKKKYSINIHTYIYIQSRRINFPFFQYKNLFAFPEIKINQQGTCFPSDEIFKDLDYQDAFDSRHINNSISYAAHSTGFKSLFPSSKPEKPDFFSSSETPQSFDLLKGSNNSYFNGVLEARNTDSLREKQFVEKEESINKEEKSATKTGESSSATMKELMMDRKSKKLEKSEKVPETGKDISNKLSSKEKESWQENFDGSKSENVLMQSKLALNEAATNLQTLGKTSRNSHPYTNDDRLKVPLGRGSHICSLENSKQFSTKKNEAVKDPYQKVSDDLRKQFLENKKQFFPHKNRKSNSGLPVRYLFKTKAYTSLSPSRKDRFSESSDSVLIDEGKKRKKRFHYLKFLKKSEPKKKCSDENDEDYEENPELEYLIWSSMPAVRRRLNKLENWS